MKTSFYDGNKILSMKDIDGEVPEIYCVSTNRSAGKTTFFGRWAVKRFLRYGEKFILLFRSKFELSNVAAKFFDEIGRLFFPGYTMTSVSREQGTYSELFLIPPKVDEDEAQLIPCGYAVSMNAVDQIKKLSHVFADGERIIFDEFQPESGNYLSGEIDKFYSVHTSIARGGGKQVRRVPVYMLSNYISMLNPYYTAWEVSKYIRANTRFLRLPGVVIEMGWNESAASAQAETGFAKAFSKSRYADTTRERIYLNDKLTLIGKPQGNGRYIATVFYAGKPFALRMFGGIWYMDKSPDLSFPQRIAVTIDDITENVPLFNFHGLFAIQLRQYFNMGAFRFSDLESRQAAFAMLGMRV